MTSINSNICDSTSNYSVSTLYDTEGEIDPVPVHVILTPSDGIPGQHTPALDVDTTDKVDIPTSLPLCSVRMHDLYTTKWTVLGTF